MKKIFFVLFSVIVNLSNSQIITTVAGNGIGGYSGDGNQATSAELNHSVDISFDSVGNLYIADWDNNVIRKVVSSTGIITTIAGNTTAGFSGDGGLAVSAQLNRPAGLAIDNLNNIYIADENNNRIRKINSSGFISTIAGTGVAGYSGDGGLATSAQINAPTRVTIGANGVIYISDNSNNVIRKINTSGFISTVVGNGTAGFSGDGGSATAAALNEPGGIVFDLAGNLYIADEFNNRIRKISTAGIITTIAGNGSIGYSGDGGIATSASFNYPQGLAIDTSSNLYIVDTYNNAIRKITASTGIISTIAGNGTAGYSGDGGLSTAAELHTVVEAAIDPTGNLYISDWANNRIRKTSLCTSPFINISGNNTMCLGTSDTLTASGATTYTWSSNAGSVTTNSIIVNPTINTTYTVTGSDPNNSCNGMSIFTVAVITINSQIITTIAGNGTAGYAGDGNQSTVAELNHPVGVTFDVEGNLYIADWDNNVVRKVVSSTGIITTIAGNTSAGFSGDGGLAVSAQLSRPAGLAIDNLNNIYIADENNNRIRKINSAGYISTVVGTGVAGYSGDGSLATSAQINAPTRVAIDVKGNIYISDNSNHVIRKVNTSGFISTLAGNGIAGFSGDGGAATAAELNEPGGLVIDGSGNIYIADEFNNRIRKVNTSGIITTIAGSGSVGYSGDGGMATLASFNYLQGLSIDGSSNLYVVDTYNNVIRKIVASTGIISTIAGNGTTGYSGDGGSATQAELNTVVESAIDPSGDLYISDWGNNRVRKISISSQCSNTTEINKLINNRCLVIFPNPNLGNINIQLLNVTLNTTYKIYNTIGQEVKYGSLTNTVNQINLSDLINGIYTIVISQSDEILTHKIIVQK